MDSQLVKRARVDPHHDSQLLKRAARVDPEHDHVIVLEDFDGVLTRASDSSEILSKLNGNEVLDNLSKIAPENFSIVQFEKMTHMENITKLGILYLGELLRCCCFNHTPEYILDALHELSTEVVSHDNFEEHVSPDSNDSISAPYFLNDVWKMLNAVPLSTDGQLNNEGVTFISTLNAAGLSLYSVMKAVLVVSDAEHDGCYERGHASLSGVRYVQLGQVLLHKKHPTIADMMPLIEALLQSESVSMVGIDAAPGGLYEKVSALMEAWLQKHPAIIRYLGAAE